MNTGNYYKLHHFIPWTRMKILYMVAVSTVPTSLYYFLDWHWLGIPWVPVALVGTAAAFIAGFRNTQTYNRLWEARQIWGGIVNSSRTWGIMVKDFVRTEDLDEERGLHQQLFYRHFAWLTALRFQLRESRSWENVKTKSYNREYLNYYLVPEWECGVEVDLVNYLSEEELNLILSKKNKAAQVIALQSSQLRKLNEQGQLSDLNYVEMQNLLKELYDHQGKNERIKNFPYPRQFSSINMYFVYLLTILLPLGFLNEFSKLGSEVVWLTVPFSVIVGWVFLVLEQIGESTENPFEGGPNDVPISSMSRAIEIDLRDMLNEENLPQPILPVNEILM
ncbi:bestrophin family protein [Algoriphagus sp. A40]|uniref:bestrophin family protein n=1 Tax=Algoriphagus sp. A40 TaxID=1945863 RepID=UPI000986C499|nr:bestrophin family ion channel [Algoriphagus sp. A40]OOG72989.1 multidrug transporter [Algoriphagus sp. A40]